MISEFCGFALKGDYFEASQVLGTMSKIDEEEKKQLNSFLRKLDFKKNEKYSQIEFLSFLESCFGFIEDRESLLACRFEKIELEEKNVGEMLSFVKDAIEMDMIPVAIKMLEKARKICQEDRELKEKMDKLSAKLNLYCNKQIVAIQYMQSDSINEAPVKVEKEMMHKKVRKAYQELEREKKKRNK